MLVAYMSVASHIKHGAVKEFVLPWLADDDGKLLPRQSSA